MMSRKTIGGDLPEDLARLLAIDEPSKRIRLVDGPETKCDLTLPVDWLIGQEL